jgi:hypothetical protein
MASELTISGILRYVEGNIDETVSLDAASFDVTGTGFVHRTQDVGNSEEALGLGDLNTLGMAFFKNHDTTDSVSIRQATSASDLILLKPGEVAMFRFDNDCTAPYVICTGSSAILEYIIVEE